MGIFLLVVHVAVCLLLILIVLVQGGKGAELGAGFGGASQTIFGSRGAATFLNKLTTVVAVVFMVTSLVLAVYAVKGGKSVIKKAVPVEDKSQAPAPGQMPAAPAAGAPSKTPPVQPGAQK